MSRKWIILAVLLTVFLGGLVYWYVSTHYKLVEEELTVPFTGKARVNKFLAVERMFNRIGIEAYTVKRFQYKHLYKDGRRKAIIAPVSALPQSGNGFWWLKEWVKSGNVLITGEVETIAREGNAYPKQFKRFIGIKEQSYISSYASGEETIHFAGEAYNIYFNTHSFLSPVSRAKSVYDIDNNCIMYHLEQGEGHIIMFNDFSIFSNYVIDGYDHATLIYDCVDKVAPDVETVMISYRRRFSTAWLWLWKNGRSFFVITLVLVVTLVLYHAVVIGPKKTVPPAARSQLIEHIKACGLFQWKEKGKDRYTEFLAYLREETVEEVYKCYPHLNFDEPEVLVMQLSELSGVDTVELRSVFVEADNAPGKFVESVKTIQKLRNGLWKI
jgi:hypothetical protein